MQAASASEPENKGPPHTVIHPATIEAYLPASGKLPERLRSLEAEIHHAAHLLPAQNPIQVFVHHNTLHAFEDELFFDAVRHGNSVFGCNPYLAEIDYREKLASGRIKPTDLSAVLAEELGEEADREIGNLATRYRLRLAMLQHPLRLGSDDELRWLITQTESLHHFRKAAGADVREQMIDDTRRWVMRNLAAGGHAPDHRLSDLTKSLYDRFDGARIEHWSDATWESFTLHLLWKVCHAGVHGVRRFAASTAPAIRHRDLLLEVTGRDTDRLVNDFLIRFCAVFLDQGIATWRLPNREDGFFRSWLKLYRSSRPVERWLHALPAEIRRIEAANLSPLEIIEESLERLGVVETERDEFITRTLLGLRGWAGMLWQMETNAEWTLHPAPTGTLVEYLAVRLLLERLALTHVSDETLGGQRPLRELRSRLHRRITSAPRVSVEQRAFLVFQLAQIMGWKPSQLYQQTKNQWAHLVEEIEMFSAIHRRRVYHLAYERRYRIQTLDATLAHAAHVRPPVERPVFQLLCCIDDREESFRRHLEEIEPNCETFGVAGFYGVAMYYRGAADAHYVPLCPVVVKPSHYVQEEVVYSFEESYRRRALTRRAFGHTRHRLHTGSRSIVGGVLTALFGTLMSVPLLGRVLFPRLTSRIRRLFGSFVQTPPVTRLLIERADEPPGPRNGHHGYSLDEMVAICLRILQDMGMTTRFARLVVIAGHGSSSVNNPHGSAYDCGACGGGRGGPNARALAGMLNDPRVRERLFSKGLVIPRSTVFVGAYHNTCDDSVGYSDLDRLPSTHREDFEQAKRTIDEACRRNAHERCRRFETAELSISTEAALRHVQSRSEDLSQVRPELGHATNAICHVGRRNRVKGLFFDRRVFLTSYDPTQDPDHRILERILQAVIPVCAGINLEYLFSFVDPVGYGCGSKLPHNIASLLGVMDGAASDLRCGLPWQMVEIHEPVRILFVIETTPEAMLEILDRNPGLSKLVRNEWVQLAVQAPDQNARASFPARALRTLHAGNDVAPLGRFIRRLVSRLAAESRLCLHRCRGRAQRQACGRTRGMNYDTLFTILGLGTVIAPLALLTLIGLTMLVGLRLSENAVCRCTQVSVVAGLLMAIGILALMLVSDTRNVSIEIGNFMTIAEEHFHFHLRLMFDRLSVPFAILSFVLVGTIGAFAQRYLHREPAFHRFFLLYAVFLLGMIVASLAGTIEMLFLGWELVGLSSALLVAYFHERPAPVVNGQRIWSIYRVADAAFLIAAVTLHHMTGEGDFAHLMGQGAWPEGIAALTAPKPCWSDCCYLWLLLANRR